MVLRGQPVGEQGAADRWTALDPHPGGVGRGGAAGDPLRGAPFLIPEGPPGPFSMGRGSAIKDRILKLPICGLDDPAISIPKGPGGPFFMARFPSS